MIETTAALMTLGAGGLLGWALARGQIGRWMFLLVALASAAVVFVLAGQFGGSDAVVALERNLGALTQTVDGPVTAVAVAPAAMTTGILGAMMVPVAAVVWAFCGAVLWLVGLMIGAMLRLWQHRRANEAGDAP